MQTLSCFDEMRAISRIDRFLTITDVREVCRQIRSAIPSRDFKVSVFETRIVEIRVWIAVFNEWNPNSRIENALKIHFVFKFLATSGC